jgi:CDP-glycerol glycerophosphotransferase (TagB/SpsB family)
MKFDYEYIACGPKTRNQEEMESEILKLLKNNGYFKKERKEILDISFDFQDGKSAERIYNIILKRGI